MVLLNKNAEISINKLTVITDINGLILHKDQILPLAFWQNNKTEIKAKLDNICIWLNSHDNIEALAQDISNIALIALNFPKFGDGRAFTMAHLLRSKLGFKGEIRAIGNPMADQAQFLFRCGVDVIEIPKNQNTQIWVEETTRMSHFYQRSQQNKLTGSRY